MITKNESFIAQIKLRELAQQRVRLSQIYDELEQQVEQAAMQGDQLQIIFANLRKIKMMKTPLHPDVVNLELLLNGSHFSQETNSFWRRHLAQELSQGRLRSELIYTFGALLDEWVQEKNQGVPLDSAGLDKAAQFLQLASQSAETLSDFSLLDDLFADRNFMDMDIAALFQGWAGNILQDDITTLELKEVLEHLSTNINHTSTIRGQAKDFLRDDIMCKELADALSILLTHIDEWDWSEEGVNFFPLWTMSKWRLFITYDLFTRCFLEVLGARLQSAFQRFLVAECQERERQLHALLDESSRHDQALLLQQLLHLGRLANSDIWANLFRGPDIPVGIEDLKHYKREIYSSSVIANREAEREVLVGASIMPDGYKISSAADGWGTTLRFINAEIQLARSAFPSSPFYVLRFDIKDFYPSLSHDLVLAVLERYGFSQSQLAFFRKFLQMHVHDGDKNIAVQRGIPLSHYFSSVMGEMVLQLLDQHVLRSAHVQVIRLVDDVCILARSADDAIKAWQAAQQFCQSTGLIINQQKCGAVCIGGDVPAQLPTSRPGWLLITLNEDGQWQVDMDAFRGYLELARRRVLYDQSLLTQIDTYNAHVKHLIRATAMECNLGDAHRRSIEVAAVHFHQAFFAEGRGMVEALRQAIQQRFFANGSTLALPEAWLYWPVTAGGCGLAHVMVLASGYAEQYALEQPRTVPEKWCAYWERDNFAWYVFYLSLTNSIDLKQPEITDGMVEDFVRRANEMSNGTQDMSGPYWRWIFYIYGPQILEYLGTFRFLSTDLVPLQIILQQYHRTFQKPERRNNHDDWDLF